MTTSTENKRLLKDIFAALERGETRPFREAMAEDFTWTATGTTHWSGVYRGKRAVLDELFAPLFAQFADRYTNHATRFIAEGEYVVVECKGRVTTTSGERYDNEYCYVCRLGDGKLRELTEYFDTALVAAVLAPPARSAVRSSSTARSARAGG